MNHSTKIKILTLLTQAVILVGAGHGGGPLGLFELIGLIQPFDGDHLHDKVDQTIFLYAIIALVGQVCIIASIFSARQTRRVRLHLLGVLVLFGATFFIGAVAYVNPYTVFLYWTAIPFLICFLLALAWTRLKHLLSKVP